MLDGSDSSQTPTLPTTGLSHGLRLRPATDADAAFIVHERRQPRAAAFLGDTSPSLACQRRWLARQRSVANDHYWVCENKGGVQLGTIGLYNFSAGQAEWGRFLIRAGCKAAPGCLLLALQHAFATLHLDQVFCTTVAGNQRAIALYERAGFVRDADHQGVVTIAGQARDTVLHRLTRSLWPTMFISLAQAAARVAPTLASKNCAAQNAVAKDDGTTPLRL